MPWNGNGTFIPPSPPVFPAVPETVINSTYFNQIINDIAAGLSLCITRDGQGKATGNLSANSYRVTNLAKGVDANDAVRVSEVMNDAYQMLSVLSTSTANDYVCSTSPLVTLAEGASFYFKTGASTNTGAMTMTVNAVSYPILDSFGQPMRPALIQPNVLAKVILIGGSLCLADFLHQTAAGWQIGEVRAFMTASPGRGWLPCRLAASDATKYDFANYPKLSGLLGVTSGTFQTPVISQDAALVNSATNLGSITNGGVISHSHTSSVSEGTHAHQISAVVPYSLLPPPAKYYFSALSQRTGVPYGTTYSVRTNLGGNDLSMSSFSSIADDGAHTHTSSIGATGAGANFPAGTRARHFIACDWFVGAA